MAAEIQGETLRAPPFAPADDPIEVYRGWWRALSGLDPLQPMSGIEAGRWQRLYDCSVWWFDGFARQAARDGWTTADVFGVHPAGPGIGGLIDRIGDGRNLRMEGNRARWCSWGIASAFCRGAYPGLRAFWAGST